MQTVKKLKLFENMSEVWKSLTERNRQCPTFRNFLSFWNNKEIVFRLKMIFIRKTSGLQKWLKGRKMLQMEYEVSTVSRDLFRVIPFAVDTSIAVPAVPKDNSR